MIFHFSKLDECFFGEPTSPKIIMSYFTAVFPYIVLIALLIIACREEGAVDGIKLFFYPDIEKLKDPSVWYKACEQSFFSLSIGYGNIVMIASYNKFTSNVNRNAIIISVLDTLTNILAGCVIFSVLGTLAHTRNQDINKVFTGEVYGLAFVVYPEALSKIEVVPQLWSVLFFFMLFTLGIGSSMSQIETILTVLKDKFPKLRERKWLLSLVVCIVFFSLGLPLTTNVGQDILGALNNYGVSAAIFFYATLEVAGVTWVYGIKNFCKDIEYMLGKAPNIFWKITWTFTAPIALMVIFIAERVLEAMKKEEPKKSSDLPDWAITTGWVLAAVALAQIPSWLIYVVYHDNHVTLWQKFKNSLKPSENWGPSDPVDRAGWIAMKKDPVHLSSHISNVYDNATYKEDAF